jgi:hypothetical protein
MYDDLERMLDACGNVRSATAIAFLQVGAGAVRQRQRRRGGRPPPGLDATQGRAPSLTEPALPARTGLGQARQRRAAHAYKAIRKRYNGGKKEEVQQWLMQATT